jgi:hypothetical protein
MAVKLRLTELDAARDLGFIERVKVALNLPATAQLELQSATQLAQNEHTVEYSASQMKLNGAEFGAADGVTVDERAKVALRFDVRGALVSSQIDPMDEQHLRLVKDQVRKLAVADQIYLAAPGESINVDALRAQRQPWYVETDAQGSKRLKRAFMA